MSLKVLLVSCDGKESLILLCGHEVVWPSGSVMDIWKEEVIWACSGLAVKTLGCGQEGWQFETQHRVTG